VWNLAVSSCKAGRVLFKVFVAEDEPKILRNLIRKVNGLDADFIVTGSAANGEDALSLIMELEPDVLITDIVMPKFDGLALIEKTRTVFPELAVIVLSGYDEFEYARKAMRLGVKEYLLKPADVNALKDTLLRIKEVLLMKKREKNLDTLHSCINLNINRRGTADIQEMPGHYAFFLLCMGNLYEDITLLDNDLIVRYQKIWKGVSLEKIHLGAIQNSWLLDEPFNNRKMLVVELGSATQSCIPELAERVNKLLQPQTGGMPMTIVHSRIPVELCDAYDVCMGMRRMLKDRLVPCSSRLFNLDTARTSGTRFESLFAELEKRIEIVGNKCTKEALERELSHYIDECFRMGMPQSLFAQLFRSILRFPGLKGQVSTSPPEALDRELEGILNRCYENKTLGTELMRFINARTACLDFPLTPERTAELLDDYLLGHYTEQITMENISEIFGYELSYMTQLYKRSKGITPNKRLINLRIDKAKELLDFHHELSVKVIAEIVGYQDQRYFSRIFRKYTGVSPHEHRAGSIKSSSV